MAYDEMGNWVDDMQSFDPSQLAVGPSNTGINGGAYLPGQSGPFVAPVPNTPPQGADNYQGGNWDANRVSNYFRDVLHVAPNSTSPDYWAQKWNEWGKNDPNYFMMRLNHADETGNPYMNGYTDSNIPGQSGTRWNGGNQQTGAQPYNPYAPRTNNGNATGTASNYFQQNNVAPTGQTDGTLLGTTVGSIGNGRTPSNGGVVGPSNQPQAPKPRYSWNGQSGFGQSGPFNQQSPMGAPSFYGNQQRQNNPLPQNNMGGSF